MVAVVTRQNSVQRGPVDDNCSDWTALPAGVEPTDAFSGAAPYAIRDVTLRANEQHSAPVAGKNCLGCHDGSGHAPKFDFAGTIYTSTAGSKGAANTEVRIVREDNYYVSVHSDEDGNFWHKGQTTPPKGSLAGVRNGNGAFIGHLNGAACNSCHTSSSNRLYIK